MNFKPFSVPVTVKIGDRVGPDNKYVVTGFGDKKRVRICELPEVTPEQIAEWTAVKPFVFAPGFYGAVKS